MHSACTTGSNNHNLCLCDQDLAGFHVHQNCTCAVTLIIHNQLDCRSKVNNRNLTVQNLVTQGTHDLCTGIVLCSVHSLTRSTAAVSGNHVAFCVLIELNAQILEPFNAVRSFGNQLINQFLIRSKVAAAVAVQEVLCRRVVRLVRSLDTAFCHHGVCITDTQLGNDHNLFACVICLDGSRCTGTAAADDQNVGLIVRAGQIRQIILQTAVRLEHFYQFLRSLFTLVRANRQYVKLILTIVRMVFLQNLILFLCGHSSRFHRSIFSALCFNLLNGFQHFFRIHDTAPPYFSISRLLYFSRISASLSAIFARIASSHLPSSISLTRSARC